MDATGFTKRTDESYKILIYGHCLPWTIAGAGVASERARSKSKVQEEIRC